MCKILITLYIFLMSGWERGVGREMGSVAGDVHCLQVFRTTEQFRMMNNDRMWVTSGEWLVGGRKLNSIFRMED